MRDLANLIAANAAAAGREAGHLCNDAEEALAGGEPERATALWTRAEAIEKAHWEEIERLLNRDKVQIIIDSPEADTAFLAFNRGRHAGRQEG